MLDFNESVSNDSAYGFPKLPKDVYTLRIAGKKIKRSQKGNLGLTLELRVQSGEATGLEQNGMVHFEDYWLGTEDDPDGEDPATQTGKMRRTYAQLKLMVAKAGAQRAVVGIRGHGESYWADLGDALVGNDVRAAIDIKTEPERTNKETGQKYDAREVNRITALYDMNEKLPGQRVNGPAGRPAVPRPFEIEGVE